MVIRDDDVVEYPERLFLTLSIPDTEGGVALLEPRRVAITLANDDSEHMFAEKSLAVIIIACIAMQSRKYFKCVYLC